MYTLRWINDDDGGELGNAADLRQARLMAKEAYERKLVDADDRIQVWGEDKRTAMQEYDRADFGIEFYEADPSIHAARL